MLWKLNADVKEFCLQVKKENNFFFLVIDSVSANVPAEWTKSLTELEIKLTVNQVIKGHFVWILWTHHKT